MAINQLSTLYFEISIFDNNLNNTANNIENFPIEIILVYYPLN